MFESLQPTCYGVVLAFFSASTITILLRMYSRSFIVKCLGWDDWCMLAILFFNCGQLAILYYLVHYGGGLHVDVVLQTEPTWLTNLAYALFVEEIYYIWMHWIIKMAFLLFYLRFATRLFKTLVYCTMGLNMLFTIIIWLIGFLQCIPLDALFHPAAHPTVKCLDNSVLAYVPAAFTIFIDLCIVILPIQPLWAIQVSLRKRLELISIFSLGGVVVLISILRVIVLLDFQNMTDITYVLGKLIIISSIELEVAIMVANAPSLRVFWNKIVGKGTQNDQYNKSHSPSNLSKGQTKWRFGTQSSCVRSNYSPHAHIQGEETPTVEKIDNDSEEALAKHESDGGIYVTSYVGVETHEARNSQGDVETYNHFNAV